MDWIGFRFTGFIIGNNDGACCLNFFNVYRSSQTRQDGRILRMSAFKQFFDTRQTLCNIFCGSDTTGMEGTHGQLGTRFTDGLCCNDTNGFADGNNVAVCQIQTIALCTYTLLCLTAQNRTNGNAFYARFYDLLCIGLGEHLFLGEEQFAGCFIPQIVYQVPTNQTFCQRFDQFVAVADFVNFQAFCCTAVFFPDNDFLGNIYQTTCQVTRVSGTKSRIGQALTCTTRGNEVFQDVQTFTVVGTNWHFDGSTRCIGDQSTHAGELTNLRNTTTGTGVCHHEDRVKLAQTSLQCSGNIVSCLVPDIDKLLGFFSRGNITIFILCGDIGNFSVCFFQNALLCLRDFCIADSNGDRSLCGIFKASCLDFIQNLRSGCSAVNPDAAFDDIRQLLLANQEGNFQVELLVRIGTVYIPQVLRNVFIKDQTTNGAVDDLGNGLFADVLGNAHFDFCVQCHIAFIVCHQCFVDIPEDLTFARFAILDHGQVVGTQNHILCWYGNRAAIGRLQQVVGSQHQESCFCLCFCGQRQMDCHLVSVEVCVKCGANQRMQLQGTTFYQNRFKCLNTQSVQGRCTVQQNWVALNNIFQCIPNLSGSTVYHFPCALDVGDDLCIDQTLQNERLEEFQCHFLWQTALVHFQFRTNDDNGTSRVVDTLTK